MLKWICSVFGGQNENQIVGLFQLNEDPKSEQVHSKPVKNKELKLSDLMKGN